MDELRKQRNTTLLHHVRDGDTEAVRKMIAEGNVDADNPKFLRNALYLGDEDTALLLLEHYPELADCELCNEKKRALHYACWIGSDNNAIFKKLISMGVAVDIPDISGNTPLMVAGGNNQLQTFRTLLSMGANPRHENNEHQTPMFYNSNEKVCQILIDAGVSVNESASNGMTALMSAAAGDHGWICDFLLAQGANLLAVDKEGMTALDHAVSKDRMSSTARLLRHGANPDFRSDGKSLMKFAIDNNAAYAAYALIRYGADTKMLGDASVTETKINMRNQSTEALSPRPTRDKVFKNGFVSDAILDACVSGEFSTLVVQPLLDDGTPESRQLLVDICQKLPQRWKNENQGLALALAAENASPALPPKGGQRHV